MRYYITVNLRLIALLKLCVADLAGLVLVIAPIQHPNNADKEPHHRRDEKSLKFCHCTHNP